MQCTSKNRHTCYEGGGPTYGAVNERVAGWVNGEVWVEVKVVDGWRQGGVWASGWRWVVVAASGLGTSHMEAACRSVSTDPPPHVKKRN